MIHSVFLCVLLRIQCATLSITSLHFDQIILIIDYWVSEAHSSFPQMCVFVCAIESKSAFQWKCERTTVYKFRRWQNHFMAYTNELTSESMRLTVAKAVTVVKIFLCMLAWFSFSNKIPTPKITHFVTNSRFYGLALNEYVSTYVFEMSCIYSENH